MQITLGQFSLTLFEVSSKFLEDDVTNSKENLGCFHREAEFYDSGTNRGK